MTDVFQIHCLQSIGDREILGLSEVLIDCVEGGGSVGFLHPVSAPKRMLTGPRSPRALWAASEDCS